MTENIFEKNVSVLAEVNPDLASEIRKVDPGNYPLVPSSNPLAPNLAFISPNNSPRLFYDPCGCLDQTEHFLSHMALGGARLLVYLGIGLGYHLIPLAESLGGRTPLQKALVVEKDLACFRRALEVTDLRELLRSPEVEFIVGVPEEELFIRIHKTLHEALLLNIKAMKFVPLPAAISLDQPYYQRVHKTLSDVATSWLTNRGADPFDTLAGYENFLKNAKEILKGPILSDVKGLFPNRPAIIVSSGPSLNKNVHLLKMITNRAVILCVDASWKILEKEGIAPHFVVSVERTPGTYRYVEGLAESKKTIYAMVSFIFPETLKGYQGPRLFVNRSQNFYKKLGMEEDCLQMGSSTAHMAFQIAVHMGCNPIILIGQDLAFGASGLTHAKGCVHGQKQIFFHEEETFEVPGNLSSRIKTSRTWLKFLRQFEQHIECYPGLCINATEGGSKIAGTEIMPFLSAIHEYCVDEFRPRDELFKRLENGGRVSEAGFVRGLRSIKTLVEEIMKDCQRGMDALIPPLREVEDLTKEGECTLPDYLIKKINVSLQVVSGMLDRLIVKPGRLGELTEYFFKPCGIPFACEWHALRGRFQNESWANAYRLKIARDFFGTIGQLCLSLKSMLEATRSYLPRELA